MKGSLSLEFIACNVADELRIFDAVVCKNEEAKEQLRFEPLVAKVSRDDNGEIVQKRIYGRRDYSRANSKGSRGIYVHYILKEDTLYRVASRISWRRIDDYFAAVAPDGSIYRLSEEEAQAWLSEL